MALSLHEFASRLFLQAPTPPPNDSNIVEAVLNVRRRCEDATFLEALFDGGPLSLLTIAIGLLSIPIALFVIVRFRVRAWSLLASAAPFAAVAVFCHINSLSVFGYMSGPRLDTVLADVALQIQIFWLGFGATLLLIILSLIIPHRSQTIALKDEAVKKFERGSTQRRAEGPK